MRDSIVDRALDALADTTNADERAEAAKRFVAGLDLEDLDVLVSPTAPTGPIDALSRRRYAIAGAAALELERLRADPDAAAEGTTSLERITDPDDVAAAELSDVDDATAVVSKVLGDESYTEPADVVEALRAAGILPRPDDEPFAVVEDEERNAKLDKIVAYNGFIAIRRELHKVPAASAQLPDDSLEAFKRFARTRLAEVRATDGDAGVIDSIEQDLAVADAILTLNAELRAIEQRFTARQEIRNGGRGALPRGRRGKR